MLLERNNRIYIPRDRYLEEEAEIVLSTKAELFREIASEADAILNDLQSGLHNQEEKLTAISQQQCEAHSRAMENARSISKIAVNFFKTLDMHASNLTQVVEEAQTLKDQKLSEFEKKFEECAANEERRLVEKVAELLVSSNARKKQVQMAVHDLQESACSKTNQLLKEMSTMQDSTCAVKAEWKLHMEKTESLNLADISAVERGKTDLKGGFLQNCLKKGSVSAQQWQKAQESLLNLEKSNVASVDSIVRYATILFKTFFVCFSRQNLSGELSSAVSTALEDVNLANSISLHPCIVSVCLHILGFQGCWLVGYIMSFLLTDQIHGDPLQLDQDASTNLNSMIAPCCGNLRELKDGHYHKIVEITENAGECLLYEYTERLQIVLLHLLISENYS